MSSPRITAVALAALLMSAAIVGISRADGPRRYDLPPGEVPTLGDPDGGSGGFVQYVRDEFFSMMSMLRPLALRGCDNAASRLLHAPGTTQR
jgi:hypothetical protein